MKWLRKNKHLVWLIPLLFVVCGAAPSYRRTIGDYYYGDLICGTDLTVYFDSSMTSADIQDLVDGVPEQGTEGKVLLFQFADGTYNTAMTSALTFEGFGGWQYVRIYGNSSDSSLSTTKSVDLDFSAGTSMGIVVANCTSEVSIRFLDVEVADAGGAVGIYVVGQTKSYAWYNYIHSDAKTADNQGILCTGGSMYAYSNYVSNLNRGLVCSFGTLYSNTNDETGTDPNYGLYAQEGGVIAKTSTQPAGSTASEFETSGGVIR